MLGRLLAIVRERRDPIARQRREASYALRSIREFIDGAGDDWDWDDFTSCPLRDRTLDGIRRRAAMVDLPPGPEEIAQLEALAVEVEAVARSSVPLRRT